MRERSFMRLELLRYGVLALWTMSALSGCGDDAACYDIDGTVQCVSGDGPAEGLYLGTDVSFR